MELRAYRKAKKISAAKLAEMVGVNETTILRLEWTPGYNPSRAVVTAIARATGGAVMPNDLFPVDLDADIAIAEAGFTS